ncbi:hypothetical protein [Streptomyces sp. NBC_00986]|uniref:hypothetical protein n=1 Tax=Streptomyces sp. NBC_00986 TaxID=2903702 RepID=UPI00386D7F08|nr:hypothetical protein OG504_29555 [Streptomyces sp. NBC_00986]
MVGRLQRPGHGELRGLARPRDRPALRRPAAAVVPPRQPCQGYQDCFNAFVADTYAAIAGDKPTGLPTLEDGLRSARIVDAVLDSAASGAWTPIQRTRP